MKRPARTSIQQLQEQARDLIAELQIMINERAGHAQILESKINKLQWEILIAREKLAGFLRAYRRNKKLFLNTNLNPGKSNG